MRRSRVWIVCLVVLVATAFTAFETQAQAPDTEALAKKVEALEQRIATLERNLKQQLANIERRLAQEGTGGASLEAEAMAALNQVNRSVVAGDLDKAKVDLDQFMQKYASTNAARRARSLQAELAVVGKDAPENWGIEKWFQGEDQIDLTGGKTTLIVFWETWCPHCQREVPKLQSIYAELKDEGLQLIGLTKITKSSTEAKVEEFIAQSGLEYAVAKENGVATRHFNVAGIPAAAVIKDGKIVWRGHPARLSQDQLRKWL